MAVCRECHRKMSKTLAFHTRIIGTSDENASSLQNPRNKIPPRIRRSPHKPRPRPETTQRLPRHHRRPTLTPNRPLHPLQQILPLVPLQLLRKGIPLRQMP